MESDSLGSHVRRARMAAARDSEGDGTADCRLVGLSGLQGEGEGGAGGADGRGCCVS